MSTPRSLEEITRTAGEACSGIDGTYARVCDLLKEAHQAGQQSAVAALPVITLVYDCINDGVAIEVNGNQAWWENSFDSISQFFIHSPDLLGTPVILRERTDDQEPGQ